MVTVHSRTIGFVTSEKHIHQKIKIGIMSIWTWQFYFLKAENGKPYNFRKIGNHIYMYGINNWLLREYAGFLTSPVCDIVNSSFAEQKLPRSWKDADVSPLMKVKPVTIITKHIRPISRGKIALTLLFFASLITQMGVCHSNHECIVNMRYYL